MNSSCLRKASAFNYPAFHYSSIPFLFIVLLLLSLKYPCGVRSLLAPRTMFLLCMMTGESAILQFKVLTNPEESATFLHYE